eukprot:1749403-Rhodomonas_salina.3
MHCPVLTHGVSWYQRPESTPSNLYDLPQGSSTRSALRAFAMLCPVLTCYPFAILRPMHSLSCILFLRYPASDSNRANAASRLSDVSRRLRSCGGKHSQHPAG